MKKIDNFAKAEDLIRIYRLNQDVKTVIYGEKLGVENEMFYFI